MNKFINIFSVFCFVILLGMAGFAEANSSRGGSGGFRSSSSFSSSKNSFSKSNSSAYSSSSRSSYSWDVAPSKPAVKVNRSPTYSSSGYNSGFKPVKTPSFKAPSSPSWKETKVTSYKPVSKPATTYTSSYSSNKEDKHKDKRSYSSGGGSDGLATIALAAVVIADSIKDANASEVKSVQQAPKESIWKFRYISDCGDKWVCN